MNIKLDKTYEVKTTLGTIRDIEKAFDKSFFDIINSVANMKVEEQIKLLYIGVKKANPDISEGQFDDLCNDHLGLAELIELLEKYLFGLQFPGMTEAEVQEKLGKKSQEREAKVAGKVK
ncbi:MAG: hypothetical protein FWC82_04295 [Firmicutes bacterium]|nr:hypothetical protein [Bacillota bacterium]